MPLELTAAQRDTLIAHARREVPVECCGLIGGLGDRALEVYPARNADQSTVHYTVHPEDHLRILRAIEDLHGWEVLAYYHSHPRSDAYPSPTDLRQAVQSGYSETCRFVIVSLADPAQPVVRAFWLTGGRVVADRVVTIRGP
ncbi:MAG: M67 family metallopeptidase [Actinobacteria bacterium]|nr:M67 family metallopeptidase [Actinomycetota bacterium]